MEIVVDLPAPFGPRKPKVSPASTRKEMPFTASTSPKLLARSETSMTAPLSREPVGVSSVSSTTELYGRTGPSGRVSRPCRGCARRRSRWRPARGCRRRGGSLCSWAATAAATRAGSAVTVAGPSRVSQRAPSTWHTAAQPVCSTLRTLRLAAFVMIRTSPSSNVKAMATTCGRPAGRRVVRVARWRSVRNEISSARSALVGRAIRRGYRPPPVAGGASSPS